MFFHRRLRCLVIIDLKAGKFGYADAGLTERGVHIVFVKENLTFTGEDSAMSNLLLSVMGAFDQFERELIRERQCEGIAIAKKGKRSTPVESHRCHQLARPSCDGELSMGTRRLRLLVSSGISRDTLYRYVPVKKRRGGKFGK